MGRKGSGSGEGRRRAALLATAAGLGVATAAAGGWWFSRSGGGTEDRLRRLSTEELWRGVKAHENDAAYLLEAGRRLVAEGRPNEGGPLLVRAARLNPNDPRVREELAKAQLATGRISDAYQHLKEYADRRPDFAEAHRLLGNFYVAVKADRDALAALEKAIALDDRSGPAWRDLALARERFPTKASAGKALEASERAAALLPDDGETLLLHARLSAAANRPEARALFERAVAKAPDRADARRQFASYLVEKGSGSTDDARRAAEEAARSLEIEPRSPLALIALGVARGRLGDDAGAVAPLEEAARLAPNVSRPARELAQAYARLKRPADAARWRAEAAKRQAYQDELQKAFAELTTRPADRKLLARMARLTGTHGEVGESRRYRAQALDAAPDDPKVLEAVAADLRAGGYAAAADALVREGSGGTP